MVKILVGNLVFEIFLLALSMAMQRMKTIKKSNLFPFRTPLAFFVVILLHDGEICCRA
jgi:hypothetical protein